MWGDLIINFHEQVWQLSWPSTVITDTRCLDWTSWISQNVLMNCKCARMQLIVSYPSIVAEWSKSSFILFNHGWPTSGSGSNPARWVSISAVLVLLHVFLYIGIYFRRFIFNLTLDHFQSNCLFSAKFFCTKMLFCAKSASKFIVPPTELKLLFSIGTFLTNYDVINRQL